MRWDWLIVILIILGIILVRTKKRGYFWKDKQGKKLTIREFFSRWKTGMEGITPLQQTKMQLLGIMITLIGIVAGMTVNMFVRLKDFWWWIEIILLGSLILTALQLLGIWQKYKRQKMVDEAMRKIK